MFKFVSLALLVFFLTGCQPQGDGQPHNIAGHMPDLRFQLTETSGRPVSQDDYHGKVVLLYFGYASCGDQCPVIVKRLASIVKELGDKAAGARILFVNIDPGDQPDVIQNFIASFHSDQLVGLYGTKQQVEVLAKRYRIAYQTSDDAPTIAHSSSVFIFDGHGRARLLLTPQDKDEAAQQDLGRLIP